ncbi:MAG: CoA-binding protein [Pseudomonadota bacterium]
MPAANLPEGLLDRCAPEARPALALIADNAALTLRAGPEEVEIWAENASGKRVKVGGCSFGPPTGAGGSGGGLYLSHVFVVTRRLSDAAAALGFAAEIGPGGRRLWTLDDAAPPVRFAEALSAFLGLETRPGAEVGPRARLPLRPETLLGPRAIALAGADEGAARQAGKALSALRKAGFEGRLIPIAEAASVQGLPAVGDPAETGGAEVLVIAADDAAIGETLRAAAASGTRAVLVLAPDDPTADGGLALRRELADIAEQTGLAILGPGSGGLVHATSRLALGPAAAHLPALPPRDGTGGAFAALFSGPGLAGHVAASAAGRGLVPRTLIGLGEAADLGLAEGLELLLGDAGAAGLPILLVPETAPGEPGSGAALATMLERARVAGRPVIAVRADTSHDERGRSRGTATAAGAGGGATTPPEPVPADPLGSLLIQAGAALPAGLEAALDLVAACRARRLPAGRRLGLVGLPEMLETAAGLLGNEARAAGLDIKLLPVSVEAPLGQALGTLLAEAGQDILLGVWTAPGHDGAPALLEAMAEAAEAAWDLGAKAPPFLHAALLPQGMQALAEEAQLAVFPDPHRALAAAAGLASLGAAIARQTTPAPRLPLRARLPEGAVALTEAMLETSLAALGLPVEPSNRDEADAATALFVADPVFGPMTGLAPAPDAAATWRHGPFAAPEARALALDAGLAPPLAAAFAEPLARLSVLTSGNAKRLAALTLEGLRQGTDGVAASRLAVHLPVAENLDANGNPEAAATLAGSQKQP